MNKRKTKIVCTIGPATSGVEKLIELINSGMDAARLNFSHGTHEDHKKAIQDIREAEVVTGKPVAIIQDLQGPKIRTGKLKDGQAELLDGQKFVITCDELEEGDSKRVSTSYRDLAKDVKPGKNLLLDDGYIILKVLELNGNDIVTEVVKGGMLKNNKGIIAPGISISAPPLSEKDIDDLKFGLQNGVDAVALSFVRSERDVIELKATMKIFGRKVPVISKIERFEGYSDLDDIVEESHGIMVARGDLGLEMPAEQVPVLQKEIIRKANAHGKFVITATQMLESMINNPRPTRAEASDVANAVLDGTDCVMLSAETSVGKYPFEAVDYMSRIITSVEEVYDPTDAQYSIPQHKQFNIDDALGKASCVLAAQIEASAIIPLTHSGYTARNISKYRPKTPILAITDCEDTLRALSMCWGVQAIIIPENETLENIFERLSSVVKDMKYIREGDNVVFVAGLSAGNVMPQNMIKVFQV